MDRLWRATGLLISIGALATAGCGGKGGHTPVDAGPGDAGVMDSGTPDAGPQPSQLFGPCVEDSQCPGTGAVCWHPADGWPEGYCTRSCMDRGPCDDGVVYNNCLPDPMGGTQMFCQRKCLNGSDCLRNNYTCVGSGGTADMPGSCIGLCATDADCGAGAMCNTEAGQCIAAGTPPTGSANGEACTADAACQSNDCVLPVGTDGVTPTGWNGGYCIGLCILPLGYNMNTLFAGNSLPQATCPANEVCFPNTSLTKGDLGFCFAACTSNADCRVDEGYYCQKQFQLSSGSTASFTNGVCLPIDCSATPCPTGYTCNTITTSTGTTHVCAPM